jgi:hypothetical protein
LTIVRAFQSTVRLVHVVHGKRPRHAESMAPRRVIRIQLSST